MSYPSQAEGLVNSTITLLFMKIYNLFFIVTKGSKCFHVKERKTERLRDKRFGRRDATCSGFWTWIAWQRVQVINWFLNSEFSFSLMCCHATVKELRLHSYLSIARGKLVGFIPFPMLNTNNLVLDLNSCSRLHLQR